MDESLLTCPVCLDLFQDPVNLPCAHTYCRPCLKDLYNKKYPDGKKNQNNQAESQKKKPHTLDCPECRQTAVLDDKGIDSLPKNYLIASIVLNFSSEQKVISITPSVPCDACETVPPRNAVRSCAQCQTSYCKFCCEELHPMRGALAKHELFDPREKKMDQQITSAKARDNLFCEQCLILIQRESELVVTSHKSMGHKLVGVNQALAQQMTGLKCRVSDMERLKRDMAKKIAGKENEFQVTKDAENCKLKEINREMDRITKFVQDRQTKLQTDTKMGFAGYFIQAESELDKARDNQLEISGLIGEAQTLLDARYQGTQCEQLMSIVSLKKRMVHTRTTLAKFSFPDTVRVAQQLPGTADAVLRRIQTLLTEAMSAAQMDGVVRDAMLVDLKCEERVQITSVQRKWCENGGVIILEWSHTDGQVFDIQLQCDEGKERSTREIFGLRDTCVAVNRLWHDTAYRVSVCVQGRPGTKAVIDVSTVPEITSDVQFDEKSASKDIIVYNEGLRLAEKGTDVDITSSKARVTQVNHPNIVCGTFGQSELAGLYNYWEVKIKYRMSHLHKTSTDWAFDLGIYCSRKPNKADRTSPMVTTYTCRAVKYGKKAARLMFGMDGNMKIQSALDLAWTNDHFYSYLGFFLNLKTMTFSVLDKAKDRTLYTFRDIRSTDNYLAMFALSGKKQMVKEMHLGETTQASVPNVVYEMLV